MRIHTTKKLGKARKELRNNATPQEIILWNHMKDSKLGYKFQRQHSLYNFIVDFYCAKKKLVIEIDGNQHSDERAKAYDKERTDYFKSINLKVLRFWNSEVDTNLEGVLQMVRKSLGNTPS